MSVHEQKPDTESKLEAAPKSPQPQLIVESFFIPPPLEPSDKERDTAISTSEGDPCFNSKTPAENKGELSTGIQMFFRFNPAYRISAISREPHCKPPDKYKYIICTLESSKISPSEGGSELDGENLSFGIATVDRTALVFGVDVRATKISSPNLATFTPYSIAVCEGETSVPKHHAI